MTRQPVVLIADDQPHVVLTLEYLINQFPGVTVMTTANGHDAVQAALRHQPDLVLLDVMMPQLDGFSACKAIRQGWQDPSVNHQGQIWFLTARSGHTDQDQAQQVGGDRFINKPFDPDRLMQLLSELFGSAETEAA